MLRDPEVESGLFGLAEELRLSGGLINRLVRDLVRQVFAARPARSRRCDHGLVPNQPPRRGWLDLHLAERRLPRELAARRHRDSREFLRRRRVELPVGLLKRGLPLIEVPHRDIAPRALVEAFRLARDERIDARGRWLHETLEPRRRFERPFRARSAERALVLRAAYGRSSREILHPRRADVARKQRVLRVLDRIEQPLDSPVEDVVL